MEFNLNTENKSDLITDDLGINEERVEELDEIINEAWDKRRGAITQDFKFIAEKCNTIEEFAYVIFNYGARSGQMHLIHDNPMIAMMLARA